MPHVVKPQPTPNPNALRFGFEANVLGDSPTSFDNAAAAEGTAWAEALFRIPGVVSLFGVRDFLTITKEAEERWEGLVPHVVEVLQSADF